MILQQIEIVIWHDVLNNSLSKHKSNNFRALSVSELLDIFKSLENKLRALVNCHRIRTPDFSDTLKTQSIPVLRIETEFFSTRKQTIKPF